MTTENDNFLISHHLLHLRASDNRIESRSPAVFDQIQKSSRLRYRGHLTPNDIFTNALTAAMCTARGCFRFGQRGNVPDPQQYADSVVGLILRTSDSVSSSSGTQGMSTAVKTTPARGN